MKNKTQLLNFSYVILAGFIPTILMYYLFSKIMALVENTNLSPVSTIMTVLSPVIAPVLGSLIFFKLKKNNGEILWKYILAYSFGLIVLLETYFFFFESTWNGLGLIIGICNGTVLGITSAIKSKNSHNK